MLSTKQLGFLGENLAKDYLKKKGYKILVQNFQKKWGEIDLIATKERKIIFFEIKTQRINKTNEDFFYPEDKISLKKIIKLRKMAQIYLSEKKLYDKLCQIDILVINFYLDSQKIKIRHYKNAIEDRE